MNPEMAIACFAVPAIRSGANQLAAGNTMVKIKPARVRQLALALAMIMQKYTPSQRIIFVNERKLAALVGSSLELRPNRQRRARFRSDPATGRLHRSGQASIGEPGAGFSRYFAPRRF
jgi:hypothetical protein